MSQAGPQTLITDCPHCHKRMRAPAAALHKQVRCPACSQPFIVTPGEKVHQVAAAPTVAAGGAENRGGLSCAICQSALEPGQPTIACPDCHTPFHQECWQYNEGCAVYGCPQVPRTEGLSSLEIPASYWGKEEKACPKCGQMILAAAVRCRHCGAMFSSATPQGEHAYRSEQQIKARLPAVRTAGIWLLVFSVLTCTAPLAALIGTVWYCRNRREIRAMPAVNVAMCKIAVGVAWAQTAMVVIFTMLYAAVRT